MQNNKMSTWLLFLFLILFAGLFVFKNLPKTSEPVIDLTPSDPENAGVVTQEAPPSTVVSGDIVDMSRKGLTKVQVSLFENSNIVELNLSNNKLEGALPAEIRKLSKLRTLKASNNMMTGVPAEIGQLSKLEYLDLSYNKLTGLPYELGNLKNLKVLNLTGNDVSLQDLEVIKKGLPETVQILL